MLHTSINAPSSRVRQKVRHEHCVRTVCQICSSERRPAHLPLPGSSAENKEADAIAAASEEADPQAKWSQADRDLNLKLSNEALLLSDKYDTANARYELHTLEAKERAGQKLTEGETEQRDFLRDHLKEKK